MIETVIGAVTVAASWLVQAFLPSMAKEAVKDYVKDFFKGWIKGAEELAKKPFAQNAVREALNAFIESFEQELKQLNLDKRQMQQYLQPLKQQFIKQPPVLQVLGSAFQGNCRYLDTAIS